ncbi:MAG: hypothetical protein WBL95_02815 [Microcoleus sp.]
MSLGNASPLRVLWLRDRAFSETPYRASPRNRVSAITFASHRDIEEETRFLNPRDRPSPRNRVSPITFASHRNIEEETRFLDPTRSHFSQKPGFYNNFCILPRYLGRNPVSLTHAIAPFPETRFLLEVPYINFYYKNSDFA